MSDISNEKPETRLIAFNLPKRLVERMKKLSKIRGHSVDSEFIEAITNYIKNKKGNGTNYPESNQNGVTLKLQRDLDKEAAIAVEKHLKKHNLS